MPIPLQTPKPQAGILPKFKTGKMAGIASFKPGFWNGKYYGPEFVRKLHDNFQKFSAGPRPYYRPYISLNHNDIFRFGGIVSARMAGDTLVLDADEIPVEIGMAVNSGMLKEPSIEFIEPKRSPQGVPVSGFTDHAGRVVDGPVIKCLTFLGPDLPGVKALPPLPPAIFRHLGGGIVSRFGSRAMDRQAMLQFLQEQGLDTSQITEVVPDALLQAVVAMVQKLIGASNPNTPNPADANNPNPSMMADILSGLTGGMVGAGAGTGNPGGGTPNPSQVVLKFNQQLHAAFGQIGQLSTALKRIEQQSAAVTAGQTRILNGIRDTAISKFLDEMAASGQIPADDPKNPNAPSMRATVRAMLQKCDTVQVRKFAHDAAKSGTEFEEMCETIRATYPVIRKFNHKLNQPDIPNPPAPRGGSGGGGMDPERRLRILNGSPLGKSVLNKKTG